MIEGLRNWIINIATTVVFITAVEMILPSDKLKKYARFVLGLILITVMLKPIITLFDGNYNLQSYSESTIKYFEGGSAGDNFEKYKEQNINNTVSTFKLNLQTECEKALKDEYPGSNYKVDAEVEYDNKDQKIVIKNIKVGIKNGSVDRVKKVEVVTKGDEGVNSNVLKDDKSKKIKDYLSKELKISNEVIVVYKL